MSRLWEGVKRYAISAVLRPAPAGKQTDGDEKTSMQHAFSVRGLVESGLPSLVFVIAFRGLGTRPAAGLALAVAGLMVLERLVRKQRVNEAISGVFGVVLAVALAGGTGDAKNFFLPEVVIGFVASAALLVSVATGKPLLGLALGAVAPPFKGWRERPLLRRAFTHITAVAGVWAAIKAFILLSIYLADNVELLATAKLALGYPMLGVLVLYYTRVVKRALVKEATDVAVEGALA
jgi:hypothetical protein